MHKFYEEVAVWRRIDHGCAARHCCLRNLTADRYSVQSVDIYRLRFLQSRLLFQAQFIQLFCEIDPCLKAGAFASLEEAIAAHERGLEFPGFHGHAKTAGRRNRRAARCSTSWGTRRIYAFIKAHREEYDVKVMCNALGVSRSGYYAWLRRMNCDVR